MSSSNFPLYDSLIEDVMQEKGKDFSFTHINYKRMFECLDRQWVSYTATIVDLIIETFHREKRIPMPKYIESSDALSYDFDKFPVELKCALTVLIERIAK